MSIHFKKAQTAISHRYHRPRRSYPTSNGRRAKDNGSKSKGPTTQVGKEASSKNAITNGLYAKDLAAITKGPFAEKREDVEGLVDGVVACLKPRDLLEGAVAKNIAHEALRQFRVANVEGCLFSKATDVPAAQWVECRDDLDAALMLVGYLEDPERERLGNWRHTLVDFIVKFTERWGYDHPRGNPDESLKQALERLGNPAEAKAWAARRVVELEAKLDSEPAWDTGAAAEMVLADMAKLGTVNTQSNRNLQRLLTEYRKLQERSLD